MSRITDQQERLVALRGTDQIWRCRKKKILNMLMKLALQLMAADMWARQCNCLPSVTTFRPTPSLTGDCSLFQQPLFTNPNSWNNVCLSYTLLYQKNDCSKDPFLKKYTLLGVLYHNNLDGQERRKSGDLHLVTFFEMVAILNVKVVEWSHVTGGNLSKYYYKESGLDSDWIQCHLIEFKYQSVCVF